MRLISFLASPMAQLSWHTQPSCAKTSNKMWPCRPGYQRWSSLATCSRLLTEYLTPVLSMPQGTASSSEAGPDLLLTPAPQVPVTRRKARQDAAPLPKYGTHQPLGNVAEGFFRRVSRVSALFVLHVHSGYLADLSGWDTALVSDGSSPFPARLGSSLPVTGTVWSPTCLSVITPVTW